VVSGRALVFFDASVLVAAAHSPTGGSAAAIEVCRAPRFRAVVTLQVLAEARVNIAEKFDEGDLVRFYQQVARLDPEVGPPPAAKALEDCMDLTTQKDAHVLAAALESRAAFLLTLDRRHFLTDRVLAAGSPLEILTPGEFLQRLISGTDAPIQA
jgi:predicted nucleic acid-binding protein